MDPLLPLKNPHPPPQRALGSARREGRLCPVKRPSRRAPGLVRLGGKRTSGCGAHARQHREIGPCLGAQIMPDQRLSEHC